ncbi:MAG: O-antigen ligase family protein [Lachnospiraceae bacterium]|jgi:hypothetical protein|nr:O-antigen ligase family protein [Lachnospiraceae bacterium]
MTQQKWQGAALWILKGFCIFSLLLPVFYSPYTDVYQSAYYGGFSWAYLMLALYMAMQIVEGWKQRDTFQRKAADYKKWLLYLLVLALFNAASLYMNHKYLHWYWDQVNQTIAFLFFMVLVCGNTKLEQKGTDVIRFLIHCIVLSNIASILYYAFGYTKLLLCNHEVVLFALPSNFYETRHYWIYSHKSEYALMLVAFTALFVCYRDKFKNRMTFGLSLAVLLFCLYLTHSWTGIAGILLIFAGALLDGVDWKSFRWKKSYLWLGGLMAVLVLGIGYQIVRERDILAFGNRPVIWKAVLEVIEKHPEGWGMRFGESAIQAAEGVLVNNAHNLFLNEALRFSVPVGILFTLLFLGIAVYSVRKSKSWLGAGMWLSLFFLLNMDYALMSLQMGLLFLVVYLVCFYKRRVEYVE